MEKVIGYKGFNKDLKCNGFQYEIGGEYHYEDDIILCKKGFHFCKKMDDVFTYYGYDNSRYALIEANGNIIHGNDKSVCNNIKIIKELTKKEVNQIIIKENKEKYEKDSLKLDLLLCKNDHNDPDLDIIMPYYQKLQINKNNIIIDEIVEFDGKSSGNDFSKTFCLTTKDDRFIKLDVKIDPTADYDYIEYKGIPIKVAPILNIIEAKIKYALQGNKKHKDDILFLLKEQDENVFNLF